MRSFVKGLIVTLVLSALTAAGVVLWMSPDPLYTAQSWMSFPRYRQYDSVIGEVARKHGVDPLLVKAVVWRESGFRPEKIGTSGERGLMQVSELAARDWAKAEHLETFVTTDLLDAKTNIEAGVWYLKKALERWKMKENAEVFALAEYNAGRTRVDRWVAETNLGEKADASDLMGTIDFPTTRRYVEEILKRKKFYEYRAEKF